MSSKRLTIKSPRSSLVRVLSAIAVLTSLSPSCSGAPAVPWQEDDTILNSPCDSETGRCWDLLPAVPDARDNYIVERNELADRAQPIHARAADQYPSDTWSIPANYGGENPSTSNIPKNSFNNNNNRHTKKDMFTSRGWGAGGMPFSVLYMKPRGSNGSHSPSTTGGGDSQSRRTTGQLGKRPPNLSSTGISPQQQQQQQQPRRHYSIIPQLFTSYGWGPSGK